jgi:hypothetical protein
LYMTPDYMKLKLEELNRRYWETYTAKSSAFYKEKMAELVADGNGCSEEEAARVLRGDLHGHPTRNHWMYRLAPLDVPGNPDMHYEFLIEYDVMEPHVGIYFGCKCISRPGSDHEAAIRIANGHWQELSPIVTTLLNNIFIDIDFTYRFKITNNAENHTFWPFWITLYEDEDIRLVAVEALRKIRHIYECFLAGETLQPVRLITKPKSVRTRFTEVAYRQLLSEWDHMFGNAGVKLEKMPSEVFESILSRAIEAGWFIPDTLYGNPSRAYRFAGPPAEGCSDSVGKCSGKRPEAEKMHQYYFPKLMEAIRNYIEKEALSQTDRQLYESEGKHGNIPWRAITNIFLKNDGTIYEESNLRNSIRSTKAKAGPDWPNLLRQLFN